MTERTGSLAFRCQMCDGQPTWSILRHGDAVITWACPPHLAMVAEDLHRDGHDNAFTLKEMKG